MNCERCQTPTHTRFRLRGVLPWLCWACMERASSEGRLLRPVAGGEESPPADRRPHEPAPAAGQTRQTA